MQQLYLDLDGVIFDFDRHFFDLFGEMSKDLPDEILWTKIRSHGTFFEELPLFDGALDFIYDLESILPVTILTACPKTDYKSAALQKRKAVYEKISNHIPVIPMLGGVNKALFMHTPGDILIDDFEKNISSWNSLGGNGILHKNFEQSLKEVWDKLSESGDHSNCDFCDGSGYIWGTPCGGGYLD